MGPGSRVLAVLHDGPVSVGTVHKVLLLVAVRRLAQVYDAVVAKSPDQTLSHLVVSDGPEKEVSSVSHSPKVRTPVSILI